MAEEEFLDLDDELEELEETDLADASAKIDTNLEVEQNNKLLYILIIILLLGILILGGIFFYIYTKKKDTQKTKEVNATEIVQNITQKVTRQKENTKVQQWLKEAKKLYDEGKKEEALKVYEKIGHFNRALSFFNIGVAKLKDANYTDAIKAFDKASFDDSLKCESALNAAVCAYNLKNKPLFENYLHLAKKYLIFKQNSPLYSYYQTLIQYYQNAFVEALVAIKHPTSDFYQNKQLFLGAKIYTSFEESQNAITMLEKADQPKNFFTLGLLYANIGQFSIAASYFQKAIDIKDHKKQAQMALTLAQNKLGNLETSAKLLQVLDQNDSDAASIYPIKVTLKKSLFDPTIAQKEFQNRLFLDKIYKYSLLFYYAPYKLSIYQNGFKQIQKGAKKIDIDKTKSALNYLQNSMNIAQIDIQIGEAIKDTLSHHLYKAQDIFKAALKRYPWDAILHYNLGLTYAQMFNFKEAYKEFSKATTLDTKLYEAIIFRSLCAQLINKDSNIPNLQNIYDLLSVSSDKKYAQRITALINITKGTMALSNGYLDPKQTIDIAINLIFAFDRGEKIAYKENAINLKTKVPKDIVANILYIDAFEDKTDIKAYAKAIQNKLTINKLDFTPLYFGETLPREMYISMLNIAGTVHILFKNLQDQKNQYNQSIAYNQSLALSAIYAQKFQYAYDHYNKLIDEKKQNDSHTLFLAAVAAIASDHHANAIALLELAKLTDPSNFESRYALGILYQEAKNLRGAIIQYKKIGDSDFHSKYFTFYINSKSHL